MKFVRNVLIAGCVTFIIFSAAIIIYREYLTYDFMRPYMKMVAEKTPRKLLIQKDGEPAYVFRNPTQLALLMKRFPAWNPGVLQEYSCILVYFADPRRDGEGFVVYVVIDKHDRVPGVSLGGG